MSRSRAKYYRFCGRPKGMKRLANKAVRQNKDFSANGCAYKRLFESWSICDSPRLIIPKITDDSSEWDKEWIPKVRRK